MEEGEAKAGLCQLRAESEISPLAIFWGDLMVKTQHGDANPGDLGGVLL